MEWLINERACSGCPSSMATLKMKLEMLKHYTSRVLEVREIA